MKAKNKRQNPRATTATANTPATPNTSTAKTTPGQPVSIVGVGASAGGLEAFEQLLATLPEDSGLAFVLVQHLAPKHESLLSELLGRATKMPVIEVTQGTRVKPNHVYVIRPNADLSVNNGVLDISQETNARERLRMSGEKMREFVAGIEAVREEERARVAREIHDELGQALTITKLDLSWLQMKPPRNQRELRKKVKAMMEHVDNTIERMRKIVSELRPSLLDDLGLIPAIEWQLKEFQKRTGVRAQLQSNVDDAGISPDRSAAVFRVVQEALTNVMRHAKAKSVRIDLKKEKGLLKISVADDGQGIRKDSIRDLKSLGIIGMRERTSRIGGEFKIHSIPGSGTRVEIVLGT